MSDDTKTDAPVEAVAEPVAPSNPAAVAMAAVKDLETEFGRIKKRIRGLWIAVTALTVVVVVLVVLTAAPFLGFRMMGRGGAGFRPGGAGFQPGQGQGQGQGQFQPDDAGDNGGTGGTNP